MRWFNQKKYNGIAIALAWPDAWGKQTDSWYDIPMRWLGINLNYYYKAGHAAIILIKNSERVCHYFDFGRFHTPFQYGRVRDESTDPDLTIFQKAVLFNERIINIREIVNQLQDNKSCHGSGKLYAAYCNIHYESSYTAAKEMQRLGAIPFGPFLINGMNCCRFVRSILLAGDPAFKYRFRLCFLWPFIPMPLGNIYSLSNRIIIPSSDSRVKFGTAYNKFNVKGTLPGTLKPDFLPAGVQWLSGEAAGSWFHMEAKAEGYIVTRYSPEGVTEFKEKFRLKLGKDFSVNKPFKFAYLSHGSLITIIQENMRYEFSKDVSTSDI